MSQRPNQAHQWTSPLIWSRLVQASLTLARSSSDTTTITASSGTKVHGSDIGSHGASAANATVANNQLTRVRMPQRNCHATTSTTAAANAEAQP